MKKADDIVSSIEIETIIPHGWRSGIKSAFFGSIAYAFMDLVYFYVNTFIINRQDIIYTFSYIGIISHAIIFVIDFLLGFALAYFPAGIFGGFLARFLLNDFKKQKLTKIVALIKGALLGASSSMLICIPILIMQYRFVKHTGHGSFFVFVDRTIIATFIAALAGAWSGMKIRKILTTEVNTKTAEVHTTLPEKVEK